MRVVHFRPVAVVKWHFCLSLRIRQNPFREHNGNVWVMTCVDEESECMSNACLCDFSFVLRLMSISEIHEKVLLTKLWFCVCQRVWVYACCCWLLCCVWVFGCVLTSSWASLAALASLSAGRVQQTHVRHLDSGSCLSYQLPGSFSQLSPPLCIPLLHTQKWTKDFQLLLCR